MIRGSLDLTTIQVEQATAVFQQALLPHQLWSGPLPVCLAEHHQGKARRLRLVSATLSHLTKAEISSLQDGPHLHGDTTVHGLVYGYAVDASPTPEWLVITDGQQSGRWRLLHNSTGPGQRCSVDCSQHYQPTLNAAEQRKAQDYTFEALHRVYFCDAWRAQPVLDALGSELVLPPQPGLLVLGCFWPQPSASEEVLSVSDVATEADDQACQTPTSSETADAIVADVEASDIVSVLSSPSEPSTLPSTVRQEEADSPIEDKDGDATLSDEAGDCLSNRPASSNTQPASNGMLEENGEETSALPQLIWTMIKRMQKKEAATDLQLEAEQSAMQALHVHQVAVHAAADADKKGMALPSLQLYSDLPREWPMARLCISNKQVNRLIRTFLWRRVAESALHGTYFGNIPEKINTD